MTHIYRSQQSRAALGRKTPHRKPHNRNDEICTKRAREFTWVAQRSRKVKEPDRPIKVHIQPVRHSVHTHQIAHKAISICPYIIVWLCVCCVFMVREIRTLALGTRHIAQNSTMTTILIDYDNFASEVVCARAAHSRVFRCVHVSRLLVGDACGM